MSILSFYSQSKAASQSVPAEKQEKIYKKYRVQSFIAITFGYALYYVCRLSMGVMKQPLVDSGLLNATQLGIIGACLYWTYAVGKFINGFLADSSNIKRFMATGLIISAGMNLMMGILGVAAMKGVVANSILFICFAIFWAINGWAQSMGVPPAVVGLSRWYPLKSRGTFFGFFSSSHNIGEGLSFVFVGSLVAAFGMKWGFFGAALAGLLGILLIVFFLHDSTQSKGLPPIEVIAGEFTQQEYDASMGRDLEKEDQKALTKRMQKAVLRNPGIWILALSSAFMYMSRYAINEWGTIFLQEAKGYDLAGAAAIIGVNPIFGIIGTVVSGWLSDVVFKGDRKYPAFVAGILESVALALFLFGGPQKWVNILAMVLFGVAIGVLISFLGGLMAVDLVPRKAAGAALGIVGLASYAAAGLQNIITGLLLDNNIVNGVHDFTYVSYYWMGAAVISFLLPILNWKRKQQEIL